MSAAKQYPDGVFNWIDLTTTDVAAAKAFYGGLFGWTYEDRPTGEGRPDYTMFLLDGHAVAGGNPMSPEMAAMGAPPVWVSYVKYDDIDAAAARAAEAGGAVFMPPMDVLDSGRMALIQDPTGAAFGIWSPRAFEGAELVNQPGALAWNELQTHDLPAARTFYKRVFDWTDSEMSDGSGYVTFAAGDRTQCGSMQIGDNFPSDVPSNWAVYFMVADVDAAAAKVAELGGTVLVGPVAAGEMGRFMVVRDPQGAVFTAMQFNGPMDPPPWEN